jgi:hypothetical protein
MPSWFACGRSSDLFGETGDRERNFWRINNLLIYKDKAGGEWRQASVDSAFVRSWAGAAQNVSGFSSEVSDPALSSAPAANLYGLGVRP